MDYSIVIDIISKNMKSSSFVYGATLVVFHFCGMGVAESQSLPTKDQVVRKWYSEFRLLRSADYSFSITGAFAMSRSQTYNYRLRLNGDKYRLETNFPQLTLAQQKKGFLSQSVSTYDGKSFYVLNISNGSADLNKSSEPTSRTALGGMPIHIAPFSFTIDEIEANYAPVQHLQNPQTWTRIKNRIDKIAVGNYNGNAGYWISMHGVKSSQLVKVFARKIDYYPVYSALYQNGKLQAEGEVKKILDVKSGNSTLGIAQQFLAKDASGGNSNFLYEMKGIPVINQKLIDSGIYSISRSHSTLYHEE